MAARLWPVFLLAILNLGIFGKLTVNFSFLSKYWGKPEDISKYNEVVWTINQTMEMVKLKPKQVSI